MERKRHIDFYIPVLKVLEDLKAHEVNTLIEETATYCNLTSEERSEMTRMGSQPRYESNIQWAITDLCQGGFIVRITRGVYKMSFEGLLMLEDNPERPDRNYLAMRSEKFRDFQFRKGTRSRMDKVTENIFKDLSDDELEKKTPVLSSLEIVPQAEIIDNASLMLSKCIKAREAMIEADLDTTQVDRKIQVLQQGILTNNIKHEVAELIDNLNKRQTVPFALIINLLDFSEKKAYISFDADEINQICDKATPIYGGKDEIVPDYEEESPAEEIVNTVNEGYDFYDMTDPDPIMPYHRGAKFSLAGGKPLKKNRMVLEVLKRYVSEHPRLSFDEIKSKFPKALQGGGYGVVKSLEEVQQRMKRFATENRRWFLQPGEVLTAGDGVKFVVCNQWGLDFEGFRRHVENELGWKIEGE